MHKKRGKNNNTVKILTIHSNIFVFSDLITIFFTIKTVDDIKDEIIKITPDTIISIVEVKELYVELELGLFTKSPVLYTQKIRYARLTKNKTTDTK